MGAIGHEAKQRLAVVEHRADDSDVGQVGAAVIGMICHDHIPRAKRLVKRNRANTEAKRAEMNRNMRGIGDEFSIGIEQCARVVEPLLHVGGHGGSLQQLSHLLNDRVKSIGEQFQFDNRGVIAIGGRFAGRYSFQFDSAIRSENSLPVFADADGAKSILNDRRPVDS